MSAPCIPPMEVWKRAPLRLPGLLRPGPMVSTDAMHVLSALLFFTESEVVAPRGSSYVVAADGRKLNATRPSSYLVRSGP